jgi:hypothetical protein
MTETDNASLLSWMRIRSTEELGDFVARLTEKRQAALECVTLED